MSQDEGLAPPAHNAPRVNLPLLTLSPTRGDDLLADYSGNLVLSFPTAFLPPGDHLLRIDDPASGQPLAHFPLRVLPPH